jgi:hypothetical protein
VQIRQQRPLLVQTGKEGDRLVLRGVRKQREQSATVCSDLGGWPELVSGEEPAWSDAEGLRIAPVTSVPASRSWRLLGARLGGRIDVV